MPWQKLHRRYPLAAFIRIILPLSIGLLDRRKGSTSIDADSPPDPANEVPNEGGAVFEEIKKQRA